MGSLQLSTQLEDSIRLLQRRRLRLLHVPSRVKRLMAWERQRRLRRRSHLYQLQMLAGYMLPQRFWEWYALLERLFW
jgi:hypothetical protein